MSPRLPRLLLIIGLSLMIAGCDSINRAFEYASRPADDKSAQTPPPADTMAAPDRSTPAAQKPTAQNPAAPDTGASAPTQPIAGARRATPPRGVEPVVPIVPVVPVEAPDTRPGGEAGLALGVREGYLREARNSDRNEWLVTQKPGDAGGGSSAFAMHNAYVVLKPYRVPSGLYGAHSAKFYVPRGVPRPTGELGHSVIYDFNTRTCAGLTCNLD
ncbi:hypothetical protein LC55x_2110 [Lysobacter capsici]|uniref:hypothetical protein n=1 Tax=Lysobacter capsici TaxID=435897 RepID=UPI000716554D|nr:hypothetical protein [Lysobacter capsici]ALN85385.1 hypothetical protein LC55x_2110 [Lysobacter capsici]